MRKPRTLLFAATLVGASLLVYFLPLFHVVPLGDARTQASAAEFDPVAYVGEFWNGTLLPEAVRAVDAGELLGAFESDRAAAANQYGHKLGLSGTTSYLVSGTGTIISRDKGVFEIALHDDKKAAVVINTGPVFGNAVRDGSGLLDVSKFPNSRDFNAISTEINRRVEETVFPLLGEKATVGTAIRFAGGVDVTDSATGIVPLKLVPVVIEFP